ncbi:MAG: FG-GAP-like repeat-containing protein [Candidatus Cloacimonetes bacterium]|nr:FG-GAP-like repeat-containing protein [Candidatus Cloacimonadota bacterium]MCF7883508.1 FG-GAP-like repeat-containing protein [Candidatus Cloacimonadota bacterium]
MKKVIMIYIIILVRMNLFADNFEYQSTLLESETVRQFEIFDIDNDGLWELLIGRHDNDENGYLNLYKQDEPNGTSFSLISEQWIYFGSLSFHEYSAVADLDNDGLWDILIGLTNGTLSHYEQDDFNSYDFSLVTHNFNNIDVGLTAIPTFVDIDNNGLLDLYIGNNYNNVKHYEQSSSNSLIFNLISEDIFQGFFYGTHIKSSFYDLDGDGLMNLMFSTDLGFYCWEQDSENSNVLVNEDYIVDHLDDTGLDYPIFFDFDGDSHPDFFATDSYDIHYYEASYSLPLDFSNITENLSGIDVGSHSVPAICDFDGDGLLELFIGTDDGRIERWKQASLNSTDFVLISSNFSGINLSANGGKTAPFFYDIDNDGNLDLLVGTSQGNVYLFEKDSPDTVTLLDDYFLQIGSIDDNTVPTIGDIDGDGLLDLLIGNGFTDYGRLKHYEQDAVNSYAFSYVGYFNDVNYGGKIYPALYDLENDGILDLLIGNINGRIYHYRQSGVNSYEFALVSDTYSLIDVGSNASPIITDLDGDGNDDLLIGEASGNINHYESIDLPTVTTIEVTNITGMGADIHGNVTDDGGSDILARGVCYNTSGNPTLNDDYRISGPGTGSFTTRPTTLHISTMYFVRTFATNAAGTSYGEELSFTTAGLPEVLTKSIHSVSTNSAVCVGEVTAENGSNVVARGILWGTSPNLTVLDDYLASGTGIGEFSITLSNLEPDSYYYVKTFARNGVGLSFGEELSFSTTSHHRNMLDFSASNGNINVPVQLPDTGTMEFWAKTTLIYTDRTLWHASGNESEGWFCEFSSNNLRAFIQGSVLTYPGITDNKWYHIAITWNCYSQFGLGYAASQLYVNGNLIENYVSAIFFSQSASFTIGTQMNGSNAFNGQMDEFRLWNTIRTENDIRGKMFEFIEPASDDLICYYSFDSFAGSDAVDNSGNGNNGTMNNFPTDPWFISTAPVGEEGISLRSTTPASVGMTGRNISITISNGGNNDNHLGIYTSGDGSDTIDAETFPDNLDYRADIIWGIEETGNVTANLIIDYSNVSAVSSPYAVKLLKRTGATSDWQDVTSDFTHDSINHTFSKNGISSFSEFTVGDADDNALPVTLSSFSGNIENGYPTLNWITESELENLGWNIYRSESENGFDTGNKIMLNGEIIPGMGSISVQTNYNYIDEQSVQTLGLHFYWLESVSYAGDLELFGPVEIDIQNNIPNIPLKSFLTKNYPNPFNPTTTIEFGVKIGEIGKLTIYNILGQKVESHRFEEGYHTFTWNASKQASGVYFYRLQTPSYHKTIRMLMLK